MTEISFSPSFVSAMQKEVAYQTAQRFEEFKSSVEFEAVLVAETKKAFAQMLKLVSATDQEKLSVVLSHPWFDNCEFRIPVEVLVQEELEREDTDLQTVEDFHKSFSRLAATCEKLLLKQNPKG